MHRITDNRMAGSAVHSISIVEAICGKRFAPNVMLLSNMWNTSQENMHLKREEELKCGETFWAPLIRNGAKTDRYHYYDRSSFESNVQARTAAREIISKMLKNKPEITQLVHEVVVKKKRVAGTKANMAVVRYLFDSGAVEDRNEKEAERNAEKYKDNARLRDIFLEEARQARANKEKIQREWNMLNTLVGGVGFVLLGLATTYAYPFVNGIFLDLTCEAAIAFGMTIDTLANMG
ncbi:hypothetical protein AOL_s00083g214 [Orbilia oligospora ATCC 24927]|uniref:Uncharacterized protein n=1 Tax=Arthrobotrys oligospora (strain ATCC 24927 / CBS 115.81 / DSM 1491) TaxID=756982 RepID=G1XGT3_ARTOA|nr:hypothetical protein AOL_s00083g214 [Orbilia oligospora ATCC 24927]EGX47706.1 hypothetical protein AOL_s00083g214 [Orbilia oligospora ATCC 24927]